MKYKVGELSARESTVKLYCSGLTGGLVALDYSASLPAGVTVTVGAWIADTSLEGYVSSCSITFSSTAVFHSAFTSVMSVYVDLGKVGEVSIYFSLGQLSAALYCDIDLSQMALSVSMQLYASPTLYTAIDIPPGAIQLYIGWVAEHPDGTRNPYYKLVSRGSVFNFNPANYPYLLIVLSCRRISSYPLPINNWNQCGNYRIKTDAGFSKDFPATAYATRAKGGDDNYYSCYYQTVDYKADKTFDLSRLSEVYCYPLIS
jgi:hypothetical protein